MSGRVREGAASSPSLAALPTALAGLLGVSLGVLGWLSAQAATFGVAEHTHITVHGFTTHRHDYAAPLAAGAGVVALLAVLLLLLVHLGSGQPAHQSAGGRRPGPGRRQLPPVRVVGRYSPAVAALLFVAVEAVEFAGSGTPAAAAAAVLAFGAGVQVLVAGAASMLTDALLRGVEEVSALPHASGMEPPPSMRPRVPAVLRAVPRVPVSVWGCRAPPVGRAAFATPS